MNGKMIAIEGIEGAGKSTVLNVISNFLKHRNIDFITTREPGGTSVGEALRDILKNTTEEYVHPTTELLLMYASRTQLFHNLIKPTLASGSWIVSDRFELSSYAYQGVGRQIPLTHLKHLSGLCLNNFEPELTLYLDIPFEISQQRIASRGIAKDRIENEDHVFFNRIRDGYLSFAKDKDSIQIIDASHAPQQVEADVISCLERLC